MFIPVNIAALDFSSKDKEQRKELLLLNHLILSSYYASDEGKKLFKDLFLYSIAKSEQELKTNQSYKRDVSIRMVLNIILLIFLLILYIAWILNITLPFIGIIINAKYIIGLLGLTLFINFDAGYTWSKKITININENNLFYLQMYFQQLLSTSKNIYVFVIDEIDKLNDEDFHTLKDLIINLKNLLTISSGRFIFITTNKFYNCLISENAKANIDQQVNTVRLPQVYTENRYPATSTLFNWKIFLPQSRIKEIRSFIENIAIKEVPSNDLLYEQFIFFVYIQSGGVFRLVKDSIRDFIKYDNKGNAILAYNDNTIFDERKQSIGRLGKIFHNLYEQTYRDTPSLQNYHYIRHEILISVLKQLINNSSMIATSIEDLCINQYVYGYDNLYKYEKDAIQNDIRDLLNDIKAFGSMSAEMKFLVPSSNQESVSIELLISQIQTDLNGLPSKRNERTNTENDFIRNIEDLGKLLNKYVLSKPTQDEVLNYLDIRYSGLYASLQNIRTAILLRKYMPQINVQKGISDLQDIHNSIITKYNQLLAFIITHALPCVEELSEDEIAVIKDSLQNSTKNNQFIFTINNAFKYKNNHAIILSFTKCKGKMNKRFKSYINNNKINIIINNTNSVDSMLKYGFNKEKVFYIRSSFDEPSVSRIVDIVRIILDWKGELEIVHAKYGNQNNYFDVADKLRSFVVGNKLVALATNELAGDPAPGVVKYLEIDFKLDGITIKRTYKEGAKVVLP